MRISFRPAGQADIPLIRSLAEAIWWRHYPDIITDEQIEYMLEMMYSENSIAEQMQQRQNYTLIYSDNLAVGYYAISGKSPGHFFLHKFYVDTDMHRRGIGSAAFDHLVKKDCADFKEISLQVNRRNIKAINFYFKKGFVIDHAFDFDIGGGYSMDDFVMILRSAR
jgi:ribosomal protein S18 acetylase RimI-like enzyme